MVTDVTIQKKREEKKQYTYSCNNSFPSFQHPLGRSNALKSNIPSLILYHLTKLKTMSSHISSKIIFVYLIIETLLSAKLTKDSLTGRQ